MRLPNSYKTPFFPQPIESGHHNFSAGDNFLSPAFFMNRFAWRKKP
jgi:hypothetical protein